MDFLAQHKQQCLYAFDFFYIFSVCFLVFKCDFLYF